MITSEDVLFLHRLISKTHKTILETFEDGTVLQKFLEEIELPNTKVVQKPQMLSLSLFNRWTLSTMTQTPSFLMKDFVSTFDALYVDTKASLVELLMMANISDITPHNIESILQNASRYQGGSRRAALLRKHLEDLEHINPGIVFGAQSIFFIELLEDVIMLNNSRCLELMFSQTA